MRIYYAHSNNLLAPSANVIQVVRMCQAFSQLGRDVTLLYPRHLAGNRVPAEGWHEFYDVRPGFRTLPIPTPLTPRLARLPLALPAGKTFGYLLRTPGLLLGERLNERDTIYTRCFLAAAYFQALRTVLPRGRRPLLIFEVHEFPARARARAMTRADGIVAITQALKDDLCRRLGIPADRIHVAPDGVPGAWLERPLGKDEARERVGLRGQAPLIVYTGRLHRDSMELLIEAAESFPAEARIVVVGPPADSWADEDGFLDGLREEARSRGLASVRFLGPRPVGEVRIYQQAADVLIAPYTRQLRYARYTSPLKIFEYMAAGRPIVASELPVLREVLRHRDNALLTPPGDPVGLARGCQAVLADPELSERLAARARSDARHYTWKERARRVLEFTAARRADIDRTAALQRSG